jgi:hypothetical protein
MLANKAHFWVESYLYRARGYRALESSVLAAGERQGFSERSLRRASRTLGLKTVGGCWELHPARVAALDQREMATLALIPTLSFEPCEPRVGLDAA